MGNKEQLAINRFLGIINKVQLPLSESIKLMDAWKGITDIMENKPTSNKFTICTDYCMRDFKRSNGNVDLLKAKSLEMALQDIKRYITYDMRIDEKSETYQVDLHINIDRLKINERPNHAIEFSKH